MDIDVIVILEVGPKVCTCMARGKCQRVVNEPRASFFSLHAPLQLAREEEAAEAAAAARCVLRT